MNQWDPFPDYEPKRTPDTIEDYIGHWAHASGVDATHVLGKIPEAKLKNLSRALATFEEYQGKAVENPGKMERGNPILGADPEEYIPSEPELVVSEVGQVILSIIDSVSKEELLAYMKHESIPSQEISFTQVTFRHADVMGSGRFFYAGKGPTRTITL